MPTVTKFDEVNKLRSTPYNEFFGAMNLTKAQKKERIALAEDIEDAMLVLFALYPSYKNDEEHLISEAVSLLSDVVSDYVVLDENVEKRINDFANEIVDSTMRNAEGTQNSNEVPPSPTKKETTAESQGNSHVGNSDPKNYWLSADRAMIIAENESNTIFNYSDYSLAVEQGYTKKTWYTMLDDKVRDTHIYLEGETIDIDDYFIAGDSIMRFPHDTEYGASANEIINCRCTCKYS